ncbi:MAG: DUF177 domain-containing protein [Flavobacteriales bacterium]|nr:DUF177 domain-containing protein [Flavobacteriales bacterium]
MDALQDHTINFSGLKDGLHAFQFDLDSVFFKAAADEELEGGTARAAVQLDTTPTMLVASIRITGTVDVLCDHCNAPLAYPVDAQLREVFHMNGRQSFDGDDEVIGLDPDDHAINLSHSFYECIRLALPIRRVHPVGQCDPSVDAALARQHHQDTNTGTDPRWAALNALRAQR